jgi:cellulose synthase/poly-beta-1,6-N-acetylglucosamine synthase-like glycosyltransferase
MTDPLVRLMINHGTSAALCAFMLLCCAVALTYIYVGYPLLVWMQAILMPRPVKKDALSAPPCSVLIVACNEAARLPAKLKSVLGSTRAELIREIVVVDDGSTDDTSDAALSLGDPRIRVEREQGRKGKPSAFNTWIPRLSSPVVVLSDARQPWSADALEKLLANFADPEVAVVSGELEFRSESVHTTAARGIDAYWRYEKFIRKHEALSGSVPGSTGALTALRRELFRPIHPDTVLDDVALPLDLVRQGGRCVFEPGALAYDDPHVEARREAVRKRRTIGGNLQLVLLDPKLLLPWKNPLWFRFVSHKLARLFSPWLLIAMYGCAYALRGLPGLWGLAWPVGLGYLAVVVAGFLAQRMGFRSRLLGIPFMFFALNISTALAWCDALSGRLGAVWDRSDKSKPDGG